MEQFAGFDALITHVKSIHMKEAMGNFKSWLQSPASIRILSPDNVQ
jgi:quinol monooxygenase YgiN